MKLKLKSFDGVLINNGSPNFLAKSPIEDYGLFNGPSGEAQLIDRYGGPKHYGGMLLQEKEFTITITCLGTMASQIDTLKTLFDPRKGECALVLTDEATSLDYYLMCSAGGNPRLEKSGLQFELTASDPVMYSVVELSATLNVNTSPFSQSVTFTGGIEVRPIFEITPGSKTGGWAFQRFLTLYPKATGKAYPRVPVEVTNGGWDTRTLVKNTAKSNQVNKVGGLSTITMAWDIDTPVGGGLAAAGLCMIDSEQVQYYLTGATMTAVRRGVGGTTIATHADNAVIYQSLVMADGSDLRLVEGTAEYPIWLASWNSATTKVWTVLSFQPMKKFTLAANLSGVGSITTIKVKRPNATYTSWFRNLPSTPFVVYIDSEAFRCTGEKNLTTGELTVAARAVNGTAAAGHAVNAVVYFLEHGDLRLIYGNPSAEAVDQDESIKPIFDLVNSTNESIVYADFCDIAGYRTGSWTRYEKSTGDQSGCYYGTGGDFSTDPAAVMGLAALPWKLNGRQQPEAVNLQWEAFFPQGVTAVSCSGNKKRDGANWIVSKLRKSIDDRTYIDVWTEDTPPSTAIAAWNHAGVALGATYYHLQFTQNGNIPANAANGVYFEVTDLTVTLDTNQTISVAFGAENAAYNLDCKISEANTGMYMLVQATVTGGQTVYVDCDKKRVRLSDGTDLMSAPQLDDEGRVDWFPAKPGTYNLTYEEAGVVSCSVVVKWRARYL